MGQITVKGNVAPGFESLRKLFEQRMHELWEDNAQLCVYVGDEKVVDLTASTSDTFSADSIINVFSSGKNFESIAMATLASRGLLDYNARVADYWPEFRQQSKHELTIAELMRHEAGLAAFNTSINPIDLVTERIKQNTIGRIIEEHPQKYQKGEDKREYHAISRGWIINEVFRRIEPSGRTIGEFLREDLSPTLGADVIVGVKDSDRSRVAPLTPLGIRRQVLETLKPRFMKRKVIDNFFQLSGKMLRMAPSASKSTTIGTPPPFVGFSMDIGMFNDPAIAMGETSSANTHCSARSLARVASMMAQRGMLDGQQFLTEDAWNALHAEPVTSSMGLRTTFTQGGVALFHLPPDAGVLDKGLNRGREGFYGWMGLGGSIFQWHPEKKIGFAFVPTTLHTTDFMNERGKAFQAELLKLV